MAYVYKQLLKWTLFAGQANYGYANAAVDMLALCRKEAGLPALAIQWGPIADVGFVAEIMKVGEPLRTQLLPWLFPMQCSQSSMHVRGLSALVWGFCSAAHMACMSLCLPCNMPAIAGGSQTASVTAIGVVRHGILDELSWGAVVQGKLQGRLMEFSTPQPIDECLSILGESMVRDKEVTAVIGVYAKAVKDGEVFLTLSHPHCTCRGL